MRFRYGYRTKDNQKREGVISASSREDVYAKLKADGKKPYMVEPLPGIWNRVSGLGRKGLAFGVLLLVTTVLAVIVFNQDGSGEFSTALGSQTRRQLIGDAAIIDQGIRTGWSDIFESEGDRFLASFAIPGAVAGQQNTTTAELEASLRRRNVVGENDPIEARQMKSMVEGMKQELRDFLHDGGTIEQYGKLLVERQEEERRCYRRAKRELELAIEGGRSGAEVNALLERLNGRLRKMGIRPLLMPGEENL